MGVRRNSRLSTAGLSISGPSGKDECLSCAARFEIVPWLTVVPSNIEVVVLRCSKRGLFSKYLCAKGAVSTSSRLVCDRVRTAMASAAKIPQQLLCESTQCSTELPESRPLFLHTLDIYAVPPRLRVYSWRTHVYPMKNCAILEDYRNEKNGTRERITARYRGYTTIPCHRLSCWTGGIAHQGDW